MKSWKGMVKTYGCDITYFTEVDAPISDELYDKIMNVINNGLLLENSDCRLELRKCIREHWSIFDEVYPEYADNMRPRRENYASEEEFLDRLEFFEKERVEALEQYNKTVDDRYSVEEITIYEPNLELVLNQQFVGKNYPDILSKNGRELYLPIDEYEDEDIRHFATVHLDCEGTITEITDIYAEGLKYTSMTRTEYVPIYPDYYALEDLINDELDYLYLDEDDE